MRKGCTVDSKKEKGHVRKGTQGEMDGRQEKPDVDYRRERQDSVTCFQLRPLKMTSSPKYPEDGV